MATQTFGDDKVAGNESDSRNKSQEAYDAEFNRIASAEELSDLEASGNEPYQGKNGSHVDTHGDEVLNNYNSDGPDINSMEKDADPAPNPTAGPGQPKQGFGAKLTRAFKKNGASGGIIGVLIGGFVSSSFFLLPGSLLVAIEKAMTNDASDATRTNIVMRRAYIGGLFSKANCKTAACEKLTKMSDTQKANWEKQGFTVELDDKKNLVSLKFPDGETVRSASEYDAKVKNTLSGRLDADKVVNIRSAFFQNSKFRKVLDKFGINRSKTVKASENKDKAERTKEMAQSIDENTKAINEPDPSLRTVKLEEKATADTVGSSGFKGKLDAINSKIAKGNPAQIAISSACAAYNVARLTTATVKAKYILDLVNFAFPFVQAASQIYYYGSIKPELVEYLSDRLTWYQKEDTADTPEKKAKVGLTAMDSQGLQMAIYGDFTKLQEFTKQYTTGILGGVIMGSQIVTNAQKLFGKDNIHNACVLNSYAGLAGTLACANPPGIVTCAIGIGATVILAPIITEQAVKELSKPALKIIADADLTSSLRGVDAGNALAAGIGLMLMRSSMGYGLAMASSSVDVNKFISMTNDDYQSNEELAREHAKSTPFDVTNQYSFMGQIALAFNQYKSNDKTVFSQIANGLAVASTPLTQLSTASALYSQPSNMTLEQSADPAKDSATNRLGKSIDPDLQQIGAVNDWSGRPVYITPPAVLAAMTGQATGNNTAIADTIDYMVSKKYINEDGSVNTSDDKNAYKKYKDYCTEDRSDPPGTSSQPVTEGDASDQSWYDGEKCVYKKDRPADEQKMLDNFAIYFNICESQYPTAESSVGGAEVKDCASAPQTPAATTPAATGGTIAIDPGHSVPTINDIEATTGANMNDSSNSTEVYDAWDVANMVKTKLEADGYTVKMLKTSVDERVNFQQRADRAKGSAMALSIHTNANGDNSIFYQFVGGYRSNADDPSRKKTFDNAATASKSKQCAEASAKARGVVTKINNFNGRESSGVAPGNMPWVQLLSPDTPWIYHELQPTDGGGGTTGPLSVATKQKYADGIVAGIKACNIPKGSASTTNPAATTANTGSPTRQN